MSLRDLLAAATPRPWEIEDGSIVYTGSYVVDPYVVERVADPANLSSDRPSKADAALIVALVNQADQLLDCVDALDVIANGGYGDASVKARAALARLDAAQENTT